MWTGRIMLEAAHSPNISSFVTLTYDEDSVPGELKPDDLDQFLNRLRHRSGVGRVRYFAVGEYGKPENTERPHYHLAVFGVPTTFDEVFADCWQKGFVHTGEITKDSAGYIAGYCTKKLTSADDPRLDGKYPEFSRQSRFPLGAAGINHIKAILATRSGSRALEVHQDIPDSFNIGSTNYPLGTYWKKHLRQEFGITEPPVKSEWSFDYETLTKEHERQAQIATKIWRRTHKAHSARSL